MAQQQHPLEQQQQGPSQLQQLVATSIPSSHQPQLVCILPSTNLVTHDNQKFINLSSTSSNFQIGVQQQPRQLQAQTQQFILPSCTSDSSMQHQQTPMLPSTNLVAAGGHQQIINGSISNYQIVQEQPRQLQAQTQQFILPSCISDSSMQHQQTPILPSTNLVAGGHQQIINGCTSKSSQIVQQQQEPPMQQQQTQQYILPLPSSDSSKQLQQTSILPSANLVPFGCHKFMNSSTSTSQLVQQQQQPMQQQHSQQYILPLPSSVSSEHLQNSSIVLPSANLVRNQFMNSTTSNPQIVQHQQQLQPMQQHQIQQYILPSASSVLQEQQQHTSILPSTNLDLHELSDKSTDTNNQKKQFKLALPLPVATSNQQQQQQHQNIILPFNNPVNNNQQQQPAQSELKGERDDCSNTSVVPVHMDNEAPLCSQSKHHHQHEDIPMTANTREDVNLIMRHIKESNTNSTYLKPIGNSIPASDCYSVIFAGDQSGFYLNVCPYSHLCDPVTSQFHRFHTIRIWVPLNCFVIFNSRLLHGGCKSERDINDKLFPDHRIFFYVIPKKLKDDLPDHRSVYPPDDAHNCAYLNGRQGHCSVCHNRGVSRDEFYSVDPCLQYDNEYDTIKKEFSRGTVIFGDLSAMGFCIATGPNITAPLRKRIYALKDKFKAQHSGLTEQIGRCMVVSPSELSNSLLEQEKKMSGQNLFSNFIDDTMVDVHKVLVQFVHDRKSMRDREKGNYYISYKPNIIFNRGDIPLDQKLHYDYCFEDVVEMSNVRAKEDVTSLSSEIAVLKKKRKSSNTDFSGNKVTRKKSQSYLNNSLSIKISKNK